MRLSSGDGLVKEYRPRIDRILDYIHAHCGEDLSLSRLAGEACLSKFHFHRIFQILVGETAGSYVRRIRLEKAAYKLAVDPMASVAQVAEAFGFSSPQNFARCFKVHFGVSPTSFRKKPKRHNILLNPSRLTFSDITAPLAVEIREIPPCRVAYIRTTGPYDLDFNVRVFERLSQWAINAGLNDYNVIRPIAARWSDPETTPPGEYIFDACLAVPGDVQGGGEIGIQNLPGGKYGVLSCEVALETIPAAIERLCHEWLVRSGYKRDNRPLITVFYNNPHVNPHKLAIIEMCLPLRRE